MHNLNFYLLTWLFLLGIDRFLSVILTYVNDFCELGAANRKVNK